MGMATLIFGPIVVVGIAAGDQPVALGAVTPAAHAAPARAVVRVAPFAIAETLQYQTAQATPTPAPTPAAPVAAAPVRRQAAPPPVAPADPNSIVGIIQAAAARWGVSGDWMVKIARCESGLNPRAYNPRGPYIGLFQFLESTFRANGGTNIYDPSDQANIAAKMLAHGQAHQWSCA